MHREFKLNLLSALVSGLMFALGYMAQSAMFIMPHFTRYSITPAPLHEKMRPWFWIESLPWMLPFVFYVIGLAIFIDLTVRIVNSTYRPNNLLAIANGVKYLVALVITSATILLLSQRLLNESMAFAVFHFKDIIADYWGYVLVSSDNLPQFLILGIVFGVLAVLLFSKHGFVGDMDACVWGGMDWGALPFGILRGAAAGAAAGMVVYSAFMSLAVAHEILNRTVLWWVPPVMPLLGLFFLPAPLVCILLLHGILDDRFTPKMRSGVLAAAVVIGVAFYLLPRVETSLAARLRGYPGYGKAAHPKALFKPLGAKEPENLIRNDTLIAFTQNGIRAYNRRNLWLDTGKGTAATLFSDANVEKAMSKINAAQPDALYFSWAISYLTGKAGYDMDIEKELQWLFLSKKNEGEGFNLMYSRLVAVAATPAAMKMADDLADPKQFHIGCNVWMLSLVFRHQGRDANAKELFKHPANICPDSKFGYEYSKFSPVFAKGVVTGRLLIGNKPAAGVRLALVSNDSDAYFKIMKQNLTSMGRENLAAAVTTDADGRFRFDGLGDDLPYFLVLAAPSSLVNPRPDAQWSRTALHADNAPQLIAVSRDKPLTALGVIRLPDNLRR